MASSAFEKLDEKPFSRFHVLAMFTTGMGVFTDGYDLASIGLVLAPVLGSFGVGHDADFVKGLLTGAALVGSAVGAVLFGALAQKGRKRYYGIDVGVMAAAAALQAFAPNVWVLIAIRFVLGIGVGADYVLSPTIMAEHANRKDRGKKLGFGFAAMWGIGAMTSAIVLWILTEAGVSPDLQWRIVLGFGMVPALSVLTLRRRMPETARFLARVGGDDAKARAVIEEITGKPAETAALTDRRAWHEVFSQHARAVFGAALLWLIYDIVLYSGVLFGPSDIAKAMDYSSIKFQLYSYGLFNVCGTLLGCALIDKIGRKWLMAGGFVLSAIALFAFAPLLGKAAPIVTFWIFGGYTFWSSVGPGAVAGSGLLGVELSPTRIRSIAQAVTVVGGRIGASIAAFAFPLILDHTSVAFMMIALAVTSLVGAALTFVLVPETANRSLEDINADTDAAIASYSSSRA
ncbi:MAG TPA: MFS transporter [Kofleriaceae bacterium]|nr:MFS transporter [Kofleriaceae bacterium]